MTVHIHPSVDNGVKKGSGSFAGGTLVCKCKDKPVKVGIKGDVAHNHACGCTQCWNRRRDLLGGCGGSTRQRDRAGEWRQASHHRCLEDHPAARLARFAARICTAASRTRTTRSTVWISSIPNCSRRPAGGSGFAAFRSS